MNTADEDIYNATKNPQKYYRIFFFLMQRKAEHSKGSSPEGQETEGFYDPSGG